MSLYCSVLPKHTFRLPRISVIFNVSSNGDPGKIMKSNLSGALWQLHPSPDGHNGDGKWFLVWCQLSHRPLHLLPTPSTDNNGSDDISRSQPSAELTENNKSEYEHNLYTFFLLRNQIWNKKSIFCFFAFNDCKNNDARMIHGALRDFMFIKY